MTTSSARSVRRVHVGLAAVAVGVLGAMAITGCSNADPLDAYLADVRSAGATGNQSDASLIVAGQFVCGAVKSGMDPAAAAAEDPATVQMVLNHCDTAFAQPLNPEQRQRYGVDAFLARSGSGAPAPPTPDQAVAPAEGRTSRGNEKAQVGVEIKAFGPPMAAEPSQWVTVTSIQKQTGACPAASDGRKIDPAVNGSFYRVAMTVRNGPSYDSEKSAYYPGSAPQFDYVTESGKAFDDVGTLPAFYCSGKEQPFFGMGPGRTYTGTVWVDLPDDPGYLILGQTPTLGTGYEFKVG